MISCNKTVEAEESDTMELETESLFVDLSSRILEWSMLLLI